VPPIVIGLVPVPLPLQLQDPLKVHVSQPMKTKLSPAVGVVEAHVPEQPGIPGACSQDVAFEVPLFESEPMELEM
jgi:hypothetical protein